MTKLDDDLYGRLSGGLLERMFAGVSAELLWKPARQSWGLGGEINYVQQRDYDQMFSFRNYDVVTGHASVYWDTGWYGIGSQVDAGRYLAGDWGATLSLKRRFANGWEFAGPLQHPRPQWRRPARFWSGTLDGKPYLLPRYSPGS